MTYNKMSSGGGSQDYTSPQLGAGLEGTVRYPGQAEPILPQSSIQSWHPGITLHPTAPSCHLCLYPGLCWFRAGSLLHVACLLLLKEELDQRKGEGTELKLLPSASLNKD